MPEQRPTYEELSAQLAEYNSLIEAVRGHKADAILGNEQVAYIKPKDIEHALRTSEEKFRTLFHSGHFAIQLARIPDGELVDVNQAWQSMFGRPGSESLGRRFQEMELWVDKAEAAGFMEELQKGDRIRDRELRLLGPLNTVICVLANTDKVVLGGREFWLTTLQDITLRKAAEARLHESDRRKDQFMATLAHELRSPLAPLSNAVEVLARSWDNKQTFTDMLALMRRQLRQLVYLVDDLMDLSRVNRGVIPLHMRPTPLNEAIAQAVETDRTGIESKGHRLRMELCTEPVWLNADPIRLVQIFTNLLNNAVKYTDHGGTISVTCTADEQECHVSISDTGIGIDADHLPRVFDMFSQVEPNSTRTHGGLGIGLSICQQLISLHGGSIEARSNGLGQGSEFIVRLPRIPAPAADAPTPSLNGSTTPLRILVVDDNADSANSLALLLRAQGHHVTTAYKAQEALEHVQQDEPQLIFMDIGMPGMDGHACCQSIRDLTGDRIHIVALTGWGQDEDRRRSVASGFNKHLVKPIGMKDVLQVLEEVKKGAWT